MPAHSLKRICGNRFIRNIFSDDEDGYASQMVDYFKDSVIQQISAQTATQGSNSLAQMLYEQAKINYNIT